MTQNIVDILFQFPNVDSWGVKPALSNAVSLQKKKGKERKL